MSLVRTSNKYRYIMSNVIKWLGGQAMRAGVHL
jgi:hypothetical protein